MGTTEVREERRRRRVVDRLFSLKRTGESDAAFARRLDLQPQHLSNYRNGHHGLSLQTAIRVGHGIGVSLDWLLLGRGEPYPNGPSPDPATGSGTAARRAPGREAL
ncbi:MAG TPA: helix-turn-helix transcriptional regulator [Gemmatimonadota bacterium]|nr:helix-turn-helix transcriptional regulator [Gemmatimonadota bacterium]